MKNLKKFWMFHVLVMLVSITAVNGVAGEYQFVGYSLGKTTGDAGGVVGMHAHCQARFNFGKTARMCTTKEWWESPNAEYPPAERGGIAWIQPQTAGAFFGQNFPSEIPLHIHIDWAGKITRSTDAAGAPDTCDQWTDSGANGTVLNTRDKKIELRQCTPHHIVTCCVPVKK
jgi:hypothetical protein